MPSRLKRYYGDGNLHFVTFSCYRRQPLFHTHVQRDLFLRVLEETRKKFQFLVVGYVVMPEHVHILITEPELATHTHMFHALKQVSAKRLLKELSAARRNLRLHDAQGHIHFWQRRWYDFNVRTDKKRIEKLKYIHRNPVKRGLVENPENWEWSSYRAYRFDKIGLVEVHPVK